MKIRSFKIKIIILIILLASSAVRYYYVESLNGYFSDSDTDNYLSYYGDAELIANFRADYLYFLTSYILSNFLSFEIFLSFLNFLFFFGVIRFFVVSFGCSWKAPFFLACCLFYPSYNSLSELVIRQGIGFAILFSFGFYSHTTGWRKKSVALFFATLFHTSFIFYFGILVLHNTLIKNMSRALIIWIAFAFFYILNLPLRLVGILGGFQLVGEIFASYAEAEYIVGFKATFFIVSALPVMLLVLSKFRLALAKDGFGRYIFTFYLIANAVGFIFSGFGYYDRVMLFSWVLIPYLLYYFLSWLIGSNRIRSRLDDARY